MEAMGLLNRTPSPDDQRKVMVSLTVKGKAMQEAAAEIPLKLMRKMGSEPTADQLKEAEQLKAQLYALIQLLEK